MALIKCYQFRHSFWSLIIIEQVLLYLTLFSVYYMSSVKQNKQKMARRRRHRDIYNSPVWLLP